MKSYIWVGLVLITIVFMGACDVTEEDISKVNEQIEERYNSFSTLQYTVTVKSYENGDLVQTREYTETFKRPNKIKQMHDVSVTRDYQESDSTFYICNANRAYSQIGNIMGVYDYVNLPSGMSSYCGYFIEYGLKKWQIPMRITDTSKYDVEISMEEGSIKAVVTVLMGEEARRKQEAIGREPKETVVTYWFDTETFGILMEEWVSESLRCGSGSIDDESTKEIGENGGGSGSLDLSDCEEVENKMVKTYDGFEFDLIVLDEEFEVNQEDYPELDFMFEEVDAGEKFAE